MRVRVKEQGLHSSHLAIAPSAACACNIRAELCSLHFVVFASRDRGKRQDTSDTMASGFSPPADERSRSTRGSDSSNPGANVRGLVPAVSVLRTRTQSRPRTQPQAPGSDGTSTPSPSPQPEPSLSSQQATFLAGAAIQTAHQASHMASSAASSALQGHQAAVFAPARERQTGASISGCWSCGIRSSSGS